MSRMLLALVVSLTMVVTVCAAERDITSREAKTLLEKDKRVFLLDVRTPQEYSQASLPGSVLIPISDFERRINEVPKNKAIIVYCAVGSRSKPAASLLVQRGYKEVYNMTDGIVGWYRNGYPIQR